MDSWTFAQNFGVAVHTVNVRCGSTTLQTAIGHLLSDFGAAAKNARMREGELTLYSNLATRLYSRDWPARASGTSDV
jgi:hypothetical protein